MSSRHLAEGCVRQVAMIAWVTLFLSTGASRLAAEALASPQPPRDESKLVTGSGQDYQTTVERQTTGELTAQDLNQASLLTSRIIKHLNEAVQGLHDQHTDDAKAEIGKAQKLVGVVRDLLPVTTATTIVRDADGQEIYRDVDTVQNDRIPLYAGMLAMEVVEPIIDAQANEAALKGLRLADANVIHTSVLADLGYIERKLSRAAALLDTPADALVQLVMAQTHGIEMLVNQIDSPLVQVQHALRLAERMVAEGKHEAARENLKLAQFQLETYRALLGPDAGQVVKKLEDDITALMSKTEEAGAAEAIRGFWERAVNLFQEEPGQAHTVDEAPAGQANQPALKE